MNYDNAIQASRKALRGLDVKAPRSELAASALAFLNISIRGSSRRMRSIRTGDLKILFTGKVSAGSSPAPGTNIINDLIEISRRALSPKNLIYGLNPKIETLAIGTRCRERKLRVAKRRVGR